MSPALASDRVLSPNGALPVRGNPGLCLSEMLAPCGCSMSCSFLEKSPDPFLHAGSTLEPVTQKLP